jgi:hypothetical protein
MKKNLLVIFVLAISISLFGQNSGQTIQPDSIPQKRLAALIRVNGDTLWCDGGYTKTKTIIAYGGPDGPAIEYQMKDFAFFILPQGTILIGNKGAEAGNILINGLNYFLVEYNYSTTDNPNYITKEYAIYDKDRKFVVGLRSATQRFEKMKLYFGDCPEFKAEIDKTAAEFKKKTEVAQMRALAKKYNCSK